MKDKKRAYNFKDLTGQVFGRLSVLKEAYYKNQYVYWLCKCSCGNEKIILGKNLKRKASSHSCGCLQLETVSRTSRKHGMFNTRFYTIWAGMKSRCLNSKDPDYPNYGGRGITVCNRWLKFINFKDDRYTEYLIHSTLYGEENTSNDRKDVNGNYESSNCKWSTPKEQSANRRVSVKSIDYKEHKRIRDLFQGIMNYLLFKNAKFSAYEKYFGCTIEELKQHIAFQFIDGMTWNNHGSGPGKWNVDHIIGCNNFDLAIEENIYKCFNYKNLRPMWHDDHIKKSKHLVNI